MTVHTVQGDGSEGNPLRSINVCLEVSLLGVELRVCLKRRAADVLVEETFFFF